MKNDVSYFFLLKYHLSNKPLPAAIIPIIIIKLYKLVCLKTILMLIIIVTTIIIKPIIVTILPIIDLELKNNIIIPIIKGTKISPVASLKEPNIHVYHCIVTTVFCVSRNNPIDTKIIPIKKYRPEFSLLFSISFPLFIIILAHLYKKILRLSVRLMERAMRIELTTKAWEALVLPLNYARIFIYHTQSKQNCQQFCGL